MSSSCSAQAVTGQTRGWVTSGSPWAGVGASSRRGMGMTEGPAGPERLKTGKSETNDRQSVTANTEQLLSLMSAVK